MAPDAVAHFPREVQARAVVLEHVDDSQALLVVTEPAGHERVEHALAGMAERRVAEVVAQRDRLGQLLVQPQHLGDRARDLRHLERVRQARPVVVAGRREEHLRLVLQPPERLAVNDAIAIVLKRRPHIVFGLGLQAAARLGALGGLRREHLELALLERFTDAGQRSSSRKLVPCASGPTPKLAASVWPRSANVGRVPMSSATPAPAAPVISTGTYSRE